MSGEGFRLFMDLLVLACLGGTIYYVLRLSKSLSAFRQYRDEFGTLIRELSKNIDVAQKAVITLKSSSTESEENLRGLLKESSYLADELQLMNETGNNLASRLEGLAEKNRRVPESSDDEVLFSPKSEVFDGGLNSEPEVEPKKNGGAVPSFFIQDREYRSNGEAQEFDGSDTDDLGAVDHFSSQAERELYEALQKNRRS